MEYSMNAYYEHGIEVSSLVSYKYIDGDYYTNIYNDAVENDGQSAKTLTSQSKYNSLFEKKRCRLYNIDTRLIRLFDDLNKICKEHFSTLYVSIVQKYSIRFFNDSALNEIQESTIRIAIRNRDGILQYRDFPFHDNYDLICTAIIPAFNKMLASLDMTIIDMSATLDFGLFLLSPLAASFLTHEVIGHPLEADCFMDSSTVINRQKVGNIILPPTVSITESPKSMSGKGIDFGGIDDGANPLTAKSLVVNGVLQEGINSLRCDSLYNRPLFRMYNTFMHENSEGLNADEIIKKYSNLVLIDSVISGYVNPYSGEFAINCANSTLVKGAEPQCKIRKMLLGGNLNTLKNAFIEIGRDKETFIGNCVKQGQTLTVGMGAPSILLNEVTPISI